MGQWGMPAGFLFGPTDEHLVSCYLKGKIARGSEGDGLIADFDIYGCDPWELPRHLFDYPRGQLNEMYFFTPRHSVKGKRCGRTAGCGVWHGNGKDELISTWDEASGGWVVAGHKASFKFEMRVDGKPGRIKTEWLMREYRLEGGDDCKGLVLCKIYEKRGRELDQEDDGPPLQLKRRRVEACTSYPPWSPDTPLLFCSGAPQPQIDPVDEDGRPDPAKRRRFEQQQQLGSATHQYAFSLEDIDALPGLPDAGACHDDAFALEEVPTIDALPCFPPPGADSWHDAVFSPVEPPTTDARPPPPPDAVARPSPSSVPLMTDDDFFQHLLAFDQFESPPPLDDLWC